MAANGGGREGSAPIVMREHEAEKPKGLLDALSDLQYLYAQERNGMELPEGLFTTKDQVIFLELGFRSTFYSGLVMALLTPLSMGVLEKMIPVFGTTDLSAFDTFYVLLLTLFYLIGYGIFLGIGVRSFHSDYTHNMVKNLLQGIAAAAALKVVIVFLLFHFIYIKVLTEEHILKVVATLSKTISMEKLVGPYKWVIQFRSVFVESAWFVLITTAIWMAVLIGCYISALRRNARLKEIE
ncbi:hypothetical protein [Geomonas subterranea]|uniref:hypothetical protein n=1 Tax=Geomonas subterranea TaxID=2847989 RepID=UPI001CD58653|nr:hypothetical protein [Geomonas fuzhouensis]